MPTACHVYRLDAAMALHTVSATCVSVIQQLSGQFNSLSA